MTDAVTDRPRRVLKDIAAVAWEHPADRAAFQTLRSVPGFDEVVKKIYGLIGERGVRLIFQADAVRVGPKQFPRLHSLFTEVRTTLDWPKDTQLFVSQTPFANAGAFGMDEPFIIINSGAMTLLDNDEMRSLLGHELGHVMSGHALYRTILWLLLNASLSALPFLAGIALLPIELALLEWYRKSELSSDRAGLLATQDPTASLRMHLKFAGGGDMSQMDLDSFLVQAKEYEESGGALDRVFKILGVLLRTHPFNTVRAAELQRWIEAGHYDRILRGEYTHRGPEAEQRPLDKDMMAAAGVPAAPSRTFTDLATALRYIGGHAEPLVVKASGLAAGKGVVVCATRTEAAATARAMLAENRYGEAGREVVIEAFLTGEELSVLALTDGRRLLVLPPAQDHKRLGEGDTGPNTGGMGAYCPVALGSERLIERVRREVFEPTLEELARRGANYTGVLYAGLMVSSDGTPYVLEFNCRFGDPETQALLPALAREVGEDILAIATGTWQPATSVLRVERAAVTTVLAARGYPDAPEKGAAITLPADPGPDVLVFHAGTTTDQAGTLRVAGGRVLNVTGLGGSVALAARASRTASDRVAFDGKTWRRDIGWRELHRAGAA